MFVKLSEFKEIQQEHLNKYLIKYLSYKTKANHNFLKKYVSYLTHGFLFNNFHNKKKKNNIKPFVKCIGA